MPKNPAGILNDSSYVTFLSCLFIPHLALSCSFFQCFSPFWIKIKQKLTKLGKMAKIKFWLAKGTASICWSTFTTLKNMKKENKCQNKILNNFPPKLIRQTNLVIGGNGLPFLIELSFRFWPLQIPANGSEQKRKRINDKHDRSKSFLFGLVIKI